MNTGGVRHPILSTVLYLTGAHVGGPTLVTDQTLASARLAEQGWLLYPRHNRLAVRCPLRPATCCFDWGVPVRRLFLSRNIEGATDAGRASMGVCCTAWSQAVVYPAPRRRPAHQGSHQMTMVVRGMEVGRCAESRLWQPSGEGRCLPR
jgi:hypothetical protein